MKLKNRVLNFLLIVLLVACSGTSRHKGVSSGRTIEIDPSARKAKAVMSEMPLKVLFATPRGSVSGQPEISISFSLPMKELGRADDSQLLDGKKPFTMTPELEGEYRWLGSRTVMFAPAGPIPQATPFKVQVPAGLKAVNGKVLEEPYSWEFKTPPPIVVNHNPSQGYQWAVKDQEIELYFNQKVDPDELKKQTKILYSNQFQRDTEVAFSASKIEKYDNPSYQGAALKLNPKTSFPLHSRITVMIDGELKGMEGPIPMGTDTSFHFNTYGPLKVTEYRCGWYYDSSNQPLTEITCDPETSITLQLTGRIDPKNVEKQVSVSPAVKNMKFSKYSEKMDHITIDADWNPGAKYEITIKPSLKDEFKQKIEGNRKFKLTTRDYSPRWHMKFDGEVLEDTQGMKLPVSQLNMESLNVSLLHLNTPEDVIKIREAHRNLQHNELRTMIERWDGAQNFALKYPKKKNTASIGMVDLAKATRGKSRSGLYVLRLQGPTSYDYGTSFVRLTDIGVNTKTSADRVIVWATSLDKGKPLGDARVTARDRSGKVLWEGKTDADGVAFIPGDKLWNDYYEDSYYDNLCPYIFVGKGDDFNFIKYCDTDSISPWQFSVPYSRYAGRKQLLGTIITERGVYRPGEEVRMKAYLRHLESGKLSMPAGRKFIMRITDSRGNEVLKKGFKASAFGSFSFSYPVSTAAPTGYYYIELEQENTNLRISKSFGVEEYRVPNFKVDVKPAARGFIKGEEARFGVSAEYLFGGAMADAPLDWAIDCSRGWFDSEDFEDFSFGDSSSWWKSDSGFGYGSGSGKSGGKGEFEGSFDTNYENKSSPASCMVEATAESADRQRIAGKSSFIVHPAAFYPGLAVEEKIVKKGGTVTARVVALDAKTKEALEGKKVKVTLFRRNWQRVESEGLYEDYYVDWEPVDKKVDSCTVTTEAKPVTCPFTAPKGGEYILKAEAKDEKGNEVFSSIELWVSGQADDISWWTSRDVDMKLQPDKKLYDVGDTAKILVQSPFPESEALITVEREGVLKHFTKTFTSHAPLVEIPITEDMRPNVYVAVSVIRGRTKAAPAQGGPDPGKPSVKVGYATLNVEIEDKRLDLAIKTDRDEYRPGNKVKVDIDVKGKDGKGRKSELAVFVVDEAVLMLTGFRLPDLAAMFYGTRELGVTNADCRRSMLQRRKFGTEKGEAGGGGGDYEEEDAVRKFFETTVFYDPDVKTDDEGRATVSFKLKDNLTTYRVMAIAQTKDNSFGNGKSKFRVNKPLLVKTALPRFTRTDDRFEAGVLVHNNTEKPMDVTVKASAEGIKLTGETVKKLSVPPGGAEEVTFNYRAEHPGEAKFTFHATQVGGKNKDAVERTLAVQAPSVTEVVATYGSTEEGVLEGIGELKNVRTDVGGINLKLASTAFVGLDESIDSLVSYPYGCAEQKTSRLIPMIALEEIIKQYNMPVDIDRERLKQTVKDLEKMQNYDGGWGYFKDAACAYPWLSAYVLWGLYHAKERGFEVSDHVIERGAEWLGKVLRDGYWCSTIPAWWQSVSLPTKVFIVDVLASIGKPAPSYHDHLYERREELPLFSKILLAEAIYLEAAGNERGKLMKIDKDKRERVEELLRDALGNVKQTPSSAHLTENLGDDFKVIMYSHTRSTAMALSALLRIDPDHFLVEKMVKWMLEARGKDGTWGTTQSNAYALLALSDYWKARESVKPDFVASVLMGESELFSSVFEGRDLKAETAYVSMDKLVENIPQKILFTKDGDGRLYYSASLEYVPTHMPSEPLDRGIYVERAYYPLEDFKKSKPEAGELPTGVFEVKAGTNMVVQLTVVTTGRRHFVVVEDQLPAGLEVINTRFKTTSLMDVKELSEAAGNQLGGYSGYTSSTKPWWSNPFYHAEFYDDRFVTFADEVQPGIYRYSYLVRATTRGDFLAPPAKAEEMYQPEVFGRTGTVKFKVK
ncbi:MAG: MG2 domain-containing protein [Pseudomonadota bacterium]